MKVNVYYFTGTGNSLAVARDISKETGGQLTSMPAALKNGAVRTEAEVLIIVFPVYMWGIPLIVDRFVKAVENISEKIIYGIATYGGMSGGTIKILDKAIENAGGKLAAGFTVKMPGNYTPMYGAISEHKQKKMFDEWNKRLKTIAEYIKSEKKGKKENNNIIVSGIFSGIIYKSAFKHIPTMDKYFWVDEKCTQCKICKEVCPVGNIDFLSGNPIWKNKCEQCFACLQWCPEEAIQYGQKTPGRKRYHHPDVDINDIISMSR